MTGRYEIKMVCEERAEPQVMAELRMHPMAIRTQFEPRTVQSVYFDTHEGRALEENFAGIADRQKLRLRWYGDGARGVHAALERKIRRSMLGTKETFRLPEPVDVEGESRIALGRELCRQCPPAWREHLGGGVGPVQWIHYRRAYLVTADRRVRVTVDSELRAFDLRDAFVVRRAFPTPLPRILVVELKAAQADRPQVEELLQGLPLVVDKCSKFVLASAPAHAPTISRFG